MKAMILAAGLGQRMRPLTDYLPKPLLAAGGKPLLDYHLENIARAGIREVIINLAYLGEKIRAHVGDGSRFGLQVSYSPEPEPLETGGAILHALELLGDESFLLINGDVWCDIALDKFIQHSLSDHQLGHLLLVSNPEFHPQGDFALADTDSSDNGFLVDDANKIHPHRFTFAGISLLKPALIANYPSKRQKFPLVETLRLAINNSQLSGQVHRGHWSDVGTPERLQQLDNYLRENDFAQNIKKPS